MVFATTLVATRGLVSGGVVSVDGFKYEEDIRDPNGKKQGRGVDINKLKWLI